MENEERRNYLVSEPNYYTTKYFYSYLLAIEIKKATVNSPVYLGIEIVEISKLVMYELWYDNVKSRYEKKLNFVHGYR